MAVKKSESPTFSQTEVERIEAKIDQTLREPSDRPRTFDTSGWSSAVKAEIERRYRAAGWDVAFAEDQRDGNFMELK